MSAATNAAMPVFSYAQAAKGAKNLPAAKPHQPQPLDTPPKDDSPDQSARSSQKGESTSNPSSRASRSRPRTQDKEDQSAPKDTSPDAAISSTAPAADQSSTKENLPPLRRTIQRSEPSQDSNPATSPPQPARDTGSPKEKDFLNKTDRTDSWEKTSQVSNSQDKSTPADKDKTKDSEDDWEKVSIPSVTAEKELKAAPQPTVNVWKQRLEAQAAAKKKDLVAPSTTPNAAAVTPPRPKALASEFKRKSGGPRDPSDKDTSLSSRKPDTSSKSTVTEPTLAQTSRPASQHDEKAAGSAPPAVDTTSWPTPESATVDDRRKSSSQDKADKQDAKTNGSKSQVNKWIPVPFVPTAKFETPLPVNVSKRGGRGGRGRDGQSRGAHVGNGNDRQEPGAMGPPPVPNKSGDQERGRKSEGQRGGRASSLPTNNRRPTSRESTLATLRKPATPMREPITPAEVATPSNIAHLEITATAAQENSKEVSRSSSRQENLGSGNAFNNDVFTSQAPEQNGIEPYSNSINETGGRPAFGQDRTKTQSAYRPTADPSRERGTPRTRDYSREKSDAAREKVESWRDRDFSGESSGRRERADRGGRGSYRGRGTNPYNTHQGHPYTSPLPQNGFEPTKSTTNGESRSRQSSQPFTLANTPNSTRNPSRTYSIPVGVMYQNSYGMPNMQQPGLSSIQTDVSGYAYPTQSPLEQGVMSAMPYNNSLNSYAVMSMVVSQIEYYFSIDNLCKDMFLRKNMDSQGWVPLRVVANFKRIKALTEDNFPWEMMRYVCSQVRNIDHLPLGDGEDKLRSRENWRDFILPLNERFPAAQSDGPQLSHMHPQQPPFVPQAVQDGMSAMSPPIRSPPTGFANTNGQFEPASPQTFAPISPMDGAMSDRNLTSPLPQQAQDQLRREPTSSPKVHHPRVFRDRPTGQMYSPVANGHRRQPSRNFNEETLFPDEDIAEIRICVQDTPGESSAEAASSRPQLSRVLSNESRGSASDKQRVSGLRGGIGAQESSTFGIQGMVFGSSGSYTATEPVSFINKDGQPSQIPAAKPGQYFITYPECHEESFKNRAVGVPDAMKTLYIFWSTFLVDKFNLGMYQEFKSVAVDDLSGGDENGMKYLMEYYQAALKLSAPISEAVASDLVQFLRNNEDGRARVYKMMRLAWRNGALNLKTRKRMSDLLLDEEKASFDKGG